MPRVIVGQRFGKWEVIEASEKKTSPVLCVCDCGTKRKVRPCNLTRGLSSSCGCARKEANIERAHVVDGVRVTRTRLYRVWGTMISRCHNPNTEQYAGYGGRGIQVCDRWRKSFLAFLEDMGNPPPGHTIDRINSQGNYEPDNCRWATPKEQARNTRRNRVGVVDGQRMCVAEAEEKYGVKYRTILGRICRGMSMEQAVFYDLPKVGGLK